MLRQNLYSATQKKQYYKYLLYNSTEYNFVWNKSNRAKYDLDAP